MRKKLFGTLIGLLCLLEGTAQWKQVGKAGFNVGNPEAISFAMSDQGELYLLYKSREEGKPSDVNVDLGGMLSGEKKKPKVTTADKKSGLNLAKFHGRGWKAVGGSYFAEGVRDPVIATYEGTPYVLYTDLKDRERATVLKYEGGKWKPLSEKGFSIAQAKEPDMAFNKDGELYVAYSDGHNRYQATVRRFDGKDWHYVGSDQGFSIAEAEHIDLEFSPGGIPHVAYFDAYTEGTTVRRFEGGEWKRLGELGKAGSGELSVVMRFDENGTPYVGTQEGGKVGVSVKRFRNGKWDFVGDPNFTSGGGETLDLLLEAGNVPFVAYKNLYENGAANVLRFGDGDWDHVGDPNFSKTISSGLEFLMDGGGDLYVAYMDEMNDFDLTVEKYERK
ncbi:MAG: hypothetical protein ABEH38_08640 [Flavobacteriales bacterium]